MRRDSSPRGGAKTPAGRRPGKRALAEPLPRVGATLAVARGHGTGTAGGCYPPLRTPAGRVPGKLALAEPLPRVGATLVVARGYGEGAERAKPQNLQGGKTE